MMRRAFVLSAALVVALAVGALGDFATTTPDNGSNDGHPFCLLKELSFSNGLSLTPPFQTNWFTYTCSCSFNDDAFTTVATPVLVDDGSTAEVTFNGVPINTRDLLNAISNGGAVAKSPNTQSSPLTFITGQNTIVIGVSCNNRAQPEPCYYEYTITCNKPPNDGGQVVGDPQFQGLRGQNYQVHGVSGEIYNIVSDADLQYNSRFVFLEEGECPVIHGRRQKSCWSHPGSYLGELGLKTKGGDRIHVITGPAKFGFQSLTVNGRELLVGDSVLLADNAGSVSRNSSHLATVEIGAWQFEFENSDLFVNQRVRVADARNLRSHGLLGQTWRDATYPNAIKYVQGTVDDYVIRDGDIFGDNFVYNAFN